MAYSKITERPFCPLASNQEDKTALAINLSILARSHMKEVFERFRESRKIAITDGMGNVLKPNALIF